MKKNIIVGIMCLLTFVYAQDVVVAEKELLAALPVGNDEDQIGYYSSEEGFFSPNGPMVDQHGYLLFYPTAGFGKYKALVVFEKGRGISRQDLFEIMSEWVGATQIQFISQQGLIQVNNVFIDPTIKGPGAAFYPHVIAKIPVTRKAYYYPLPNGSYMESIWPSFVFSTEIKPDRTITVRNFEQTKKWLTTQPDDFTIGADGLLYRSGYLWSAQHPLNTPQCVYLGRLASGHCVWGSGQYGMERNYYISNTTKQVELVLQLPWAYDYLNQKDEQHRSFNYGIGPWGEMYCLIAPIDWRKPLSGSTAELVVVRNHLKIFGRLNDGGVRLRKEPSTTSDILGTYPVKTGFRILEKGEKEETIGGQKNVWYKVRLLDGKVGWFFGSFVHNLYDGPNGKAPPWPNVPDW